MGVPCRMPDEQPHPHLCRLHVRPLPRRRASTSSTTRSSVPRRQRRRRRPRSKFVWGEGSDNVAMFEERDRDAELTPLRRGPGVAGQALRRRLRLDHRPDGVRRPRAAGAPTSGPTTRSRVAVRRPQPELLHDRPRAWSPRRSSPTAPTPPRTRYLHGDVPRRHRRLPAVLRAGRRQRPRQPADQGRARRRRVGASPARRCGRRAPSTATSARSSPAPTPTCPSTRGSPGSSSTCRRPGVEVRPLRQMTGGASFNEVFFNEVRVPDDHRLGDVNNGWTVALTTLMNERAAIGAGGGGGGGGAADAGAIEMVRHFGLADDPLVRQRARRPRHPRRGSRSTPTSGRWTRSRPASCPGPEMSIAKLAGTQQLRRAWPTSSPACSARSSSPTPASGAPTPGASSCSARRACRIAGGTDEVMRNIVGERVLGLPKDAGIDSTSPFRDLKVGTQKPDRSSLASRSGHRRRAGQVRRTNGSTARPPARRGTRRACTT